MLVFRAAYYNITLNVSTTPPISFTAAKSNAEISDSGGCMKTRRMRPLLLKISSTAKSQQQRQKPQHDPQRTIRWF